jgi:adenylate cyclase
MARDDRERDGGDDDAPLVIGLPRGHALRPRRDECLLDAAWRADVPLASSCGGQGVCGDCAVRIVEGSEHLLPPDDVERAWFARRPRPAGVRLACRLRVCGPAVVATTYW